MTPTMTPSTFDQGAAYFIAYSLANIQAEAGWKNRNAVANYNASVEKAKIQHQQGENIPNPADTSLQWESVDEAKFRQLFAEEIAQQPNGTYFNISINVEDCVSTQTIQMPPGSTAQIRPDGTLQIITPAPPAMPTLTSPVGASMGIGATGNEFFAVPVAARIFPDGAKLPAPAGGEYVMHIYANPFAPGGRSYAWELVP